MKHLLLVSIIVAGSCSTSLAAPRVPVQRATFTPPYAHPVDPTYSAGTGSPQFRWGWFGAEYYPAAPIMHRDYTRGWREWHSRR